MSHADFFLNFLNCPWLNRSLFVYFTGTWHTPDNISNCLFCLFKNVHRQICEKSSDRQWSRVEYLYGHTVVFSLKCSKTTWLVAYAFGSNHIHSKLHLMCQLPMMLVPLNYNYMVFAQLGDNITSISATFIISILTHFNICRNLDKFLSLTDKLFITR